MRDEKEAALVKNAGYASQKQRMADMIEFLKKQKSIMEDYDEQLVRKLIETITVYDEKITVTFKSGLTADVDM